MNLVGLMPVRSEDWVLGLSARVALMWCDSLVILNHASTDGTAAIIKELQDEFPARVRTIAVPEDCWDEMQHRQMMLDWARANGGETGATHIAIIDADEILTANLLGHIRDWVSSLRADEMLTLPLYNLRGGLARYHLNGVWGQRVVSVAFKDVFTAGWKGDKHHSRDPEGLNWNRKFPTAQGVGGVMHLWGASERRLVAKHALYKVRDTLRWPEKKAEFERMYSWAIKGDTKPPYAHYGTLATWTYADVPGSWWPGALTDLVNLDSEPWQEAEVRRLVALHGPEKFAGLDLFGIA